MNIDNLFIFLVTLSVLKECYATRKFSQVSYKSEASESDLTTDCKEPISNFNVHSCDPSSNSTDLYCKRFLNPLKKIHLQCEQRNWHVKNDESYQEIEKLGLVMSKYIENSNVATTVNLQKIADSEKLDDNCKKPVEWLNLYHSCDKSLQYPGTSITSCNCTYDNKQKLNLKCIDKTWYSNITKEPTCPYYFHPQLVNCYKDTFGEIKCNCKHNCIPLNVPGTQTYEEIYSICNKDNTKYGPFKLTYKDNKVLFDCQDEYQIIEGNSELKCNNGIFNGTLPKCVKGRKTTIKQEILEKLPPPISALETKQKESVPDAVHVQNTTNILLYSTIPMGILMLLLFLLILLQTKNYRVNNNRNDNIIVGYTAEPNKYSNINTIKGKDEHVYFEITNGMINENIEPDLPPRNQYMTIFNDPDEITDSNGYLVPNSIRFK